MRTFIVGLVAISLIVVGTAEPARAQRVKRPEVTAVQVNQAITDGINYLKRQQKPDGTWDEIILGFTGGVTSLCTLALLTAGVPADDPGIQKALVQIRKFDSKMNYVISLQTMVFCLAEPQRDLQLIVRNVKILERNQHRNGDGAGGWDYNGTQQIVDNSNSQFVALALYEAERVGVQTDREVWRRAQAYWIRAQRHDHSWGYYNGARTGTGSMTCAGLAVLLMAREILNEGDVRVSGEDVECCAARPDESKIQLALKWLGEPELYVQSNKNDPQHLYYYLYGLERVGRLTNQRFIGKDDWYRKGARYLVHNQVQLGAGQWVGVGAGESRPLIASCFAMIFLSKGRRPVLVAKLEHGNTDDWDHHRKDLANLTRYCEKKWNQELTWQVMRLKGATVDDLMQAPVLFLSGDEPPNFSVEEARALRQYLDFGGFLFAENCCREKKPEFEAGFKKLVAQMFPERDSGVLRPLPADHPIWNAEEPLITEEKLPKLYGLDVGCRTSIVYSDEPLGCFWELDRLARTTKYPESVEAKVRMKRSVGINVMAYATNREVKYKLDIAPVVADDDKQNVVERARLDVAELRQSGSSIAPRALVNLLRQLGARSGVRVNTEKREIALTQDSLFDHHLVFMHGRTSFTFTEAERKLLRSFITNGGMVFGDAVCSSEEFASSFRREMALVFPDAPLKQIPVKHELFTDKFGGFDLSQVTLRDPRRRNVGGPARADEIKAPPELEGLQFGERFGVIFSKYDLSCALERQNSIECAGYNQSDAAKIGINIILYSLRGNL